LITREFCCSVFFLGDFVEGVHTSTSATEISEEVGLPSKRSPDGVIESLTEGKLISIGGDSIAKLEVSIFEVVALNIFCFLLPCFLLKRI
jgi:hypothetical protein